MILSIADDVHICLGEEGVDLPVAIAFDLGISARRYASIHV